MKRPLALYILPVLICLGCSYDTTQNCTEAIENEWMNLTNTTNHNKEILINVVKDRIEASVYKFSGIVGTKDDYYLGVDTIYFSPKKDKFIALLLVKDGVGFNYFNNECREYGYTFNGNTIVGYRVSEGKWRIYTYTQYTPMGFSHPKKVQELMHNFYEKTLPNTKVDYWTGKTGSYGGLEYNQLSIGHSVNDKEFWESVFWKRGLIYKNYYNFELAASIVHTQNDKNVLDTSLVKLKFY